MPDEPPGERPGRLRRIAALAGFAALSLPLQLLALRAFWAPGSLPEEEARRAHFELHDGRVSIALGGRLHPYMHPDVALADEGDALLVPPGRTLAVPLDAGLVYRVEVEEGGAPPYVVFAERSGGDPARLAASEVLDVDRDGLVWRRWVDRPWAEDEAWRRRLEERCGPDAALVARGGDEAAEVELGRCAASRPAPDGSVLAVVAGPDRVRFERPSDPWRPKRPVLASRLEPTVPLLLLALPLWLAGFRREGALALSALLALLSLVFPETACLGWFVAAPVALLASLARGVGGVARRPRLLLGPGAVVVLLVLLRDAAPPPGPPAGGAPLPAPDTPACLLVGYSNVNGVGLREGADGPLEHLERCAPCASGADRRANNGAKFDYVERGLCDGRFPVGPETRVLFLGGDNDDHFWSTEARERGAARGLSVLRQLVGFYGPWLPSLRRSSDFPPEGYIHSAERSLDAIDLQRASLQSGMQCAREREAEFLFFHNLLVTDLPDGPSRERLVLRAMRRGEVRGAGNRFDDLLDVFDGEIGVAWFSDRVHFSDVGHRRVAAHMCSALER